MRAFTVRLSDIGRCPKGNWSPRHYFPDGSCGCTHPELAARLAEVEEAVTAHADALKLLRAEATELRARLGLGPRR